MDGSLKIFAGETVIGSAEAVREGLYLRFLCRCGPPRGQILHLVATCGDRQEKLGIPAPEGGELVLRRKIPARRLPGGPWKIEVLGAETSKKPEKSKESDHIPEKNMEPVESPAPVSEAPPEVAKESPDASPLSEETPELSAESEGKSGPGHFVPLGEDGEFSELSRLREGRYACQDGVPGVLFP